MTTAIAKDNGVGVLRWDNRAVGTATGASVVLTVPDLTIKYPVPRYERQILSQTTDGAGGTSTTFRRVLSRYEMLDTLAVFPPGGQIKATYRPVSTDAHASEEVTLDTLQFDLTRGYAETITRDSVRFQFGGSVYVLRSGVLYRDPSPATGAGTVAGTLDATSGRVRLTAWPEGGANAVTLDACLTQVGGQPVDACTFRTPVSPLKPGTLQVRWTDCTGAAFDKVVDSTGVLEDDDCTLLVDYPRGVVRLRFGQWKTVASLTPAELAKPWYDPAAIVLRGGVQSIWAARPVLADSITYNAVAQTYLPPDSDLLGLDAARLPPDGRALIYRPGMLVLVHHTAPIAIPALVAGAVHACGRTRLYRVTIEDSTGARLPADQYQVNRATGDVTLADPLDQTGFTPPWTLRHSIADLRRVRDTDINGTLTLLQRLSYAFPAGDAPSQVSGVLFIGTLQARIVHLFAQGTWLGTWTDALDGEAPLAQFNDALYPIAVTDQGAYPDRYLIQFTTSTAFRVIGEHLGMIAIGDITLDCAPVNPLTGVPFFAIDARGWGLGWSVGNCLRFNVQGASYPIDLVRAVQPSAPTELVDAVELLLIGNIDA